jgi:hypothetical protein
MIKRNHLESMLLFSRGTSRSSSMISGGYVV